MCIPWGDRWRLQPETVPGIGQNRHTDIGDSLHNPVIGLGGLGQGAGRKIVDGDFTVGAGFHFFDPFFSQLALNMGGGKKIGISQLRFGRCIQTEECAKTKYQ